MRVSISYSIDLEEVPEKVRELLQKDVLNIRREALMSLDEAVDSLSTPDINRVAIGLENVAQAQTILEDATAKLVDYSNILKGFLNAKVQLAERAQNQATAPPQPQPAPPNNKPEQESEEPEV